MFVHGPDVLIDTPADIREQLNRSQVRRIAACFYSHWHPDHTMGRHVFSTINADYRVWPSAPRGVIDVYLPERVAVDARHHLALWEHLRFLEQGEHVIRLHELAAGEVVHVADTTVHPLPLAQEFVYAFLFLECDRRLLVVPDEIDRWSPPPEVRGVDVAVIPMGIVEHDPITGERRIATEHPVLRTEATFEQTLAIVEELQARRVVMTHIEESDGLSHNDLKHVAALMCRRGINLTFAFDTLTVEV